MDKQQFFNLLYVVLIVALISFMIYMVMWLQTESKDCLSDPIVYFEDKNPDAECYCIKANDVFYVNYDRMPNTENYDNNNIK